MMDILKKYKHIIGGVLLGGVILFGIVFFSLKFGLGEKNPQKYASTAEKHKSFISQIRKLSSEQLIELYGRNLKNKYPPKIDKQTYLCVIFYDVENDLDYLDEIYLDLPKEISLSFSLSSKELLNLSKDISSDERSVILNMENFTNKDLVYLISLQENLSLNLYVKNTTLLQNQTFLGFIEGNHHVNSLIIGQGIVLDDAFLTVKIPTFYIHATIDYSYNLSNLIDFEKGIIKTSKSVSPIIIAIPFNRIHVDYMLKILERVNYNNVQLISYHDLVKSKNKKKTIA